MHHPFLAYFSSTWQRKKIKGEPTNSQSWALNNPNLDSELLQNQWDTSGKFPDESWSKYRGIKIAMQSYIQVEHKVYIKCKWIWLLDFYVTPRLSYYAHANIPRSGGGSKYFWLSAFLKRAPQPLISSWIPHGAWNLQHYTPKHVLLVSWGQLIH